MTGIAHQYKKRLEFAESEKENPYWLDYDLDLKKSVIRQITAKEAKQIIVKYEYLGIMSAISQFCYGLFFPHKNDAEKEICGGAVVFGSEYAEAIHRWDKYGYNGKILLLNRGVCLHFTPPNSGSKLIMGAIKQLPEKYRVITATIDPEAGEVGTLYQSCNWHYVGEMRRGRRRLAMITDRGKFTSITLLRKYGTVSKPKLMEMFPDAEFTTIPNKGRYFYFKDKSDVKAIEHLIKPYPKRDPELKIEPGCCQFAGCGKKTVAKGYCMTHYRRLKRNGSLITKYITGTEKCKDCGVEKSRRWLLGLCESCYFKNRNHKD